MTEGIKQCVKCGQMKVLGEFYIRSDKPSERVSRCKKCISKQQKEWKESANGLASNAAKQERAEKIWASHTRGEMSATMKRCKRCGEDKVLTAFYKQQKMLDGYTAMCKKCTLKTQKEQKETLSGLQAKAFKRERAEKVWANLVMDGIPESMKRCKYCGESKPITAFLKRFGSPSGYDSRCKKCSAERQGKWRKTPNGKKSRTLEYAKRDKVRWKQSLVKNKYGLSVSQQNELFQRKFCEICGCPFLDQRPPHIDHDHDTGEVRGVLCQACNCMIGYAKNDPRVLEKAIAYLKRPQGVRIVPEEACCFWGVGPVRKERRVLLQAVPESSGLEDIGTDAQLSKKKCS